MGLFSLRVPKLPHYTRYHPILPTAERLLAEPTRSVLTADRVLIDSKPLPVANPDPTSPLVSPYPQRGTPALGKRSCWSKFPEAMANTMGLVFGCKLHALPGLEGLFASWALAAANHTDPTRTQRVRL